jgi:hypothetical protein
MRSFLLPIALSIATPALAQQGQAPATPGTAPVRPGQPPATIIAEPVAMMIAAFDRDGDARVTRAEFDAGVRHSFDSVDTAHAGSIGYIGFADWSLRWLGSRNAVPDPYEVDRNDDNRITADELLDRFALLFTRFDADKDGVIVRSELLTVRTPPMEGGRRGKRRRD